MPAYVELQSGLGAHGGGGGAAAARRGGRGRGPEARGGALGDALRRSGAGRHRFGPHRPTRRCGQGANSKRSESHPNFVRTSFFAVPKLIFAKKYSCRSCSSFEDLQDECTFELAPAKKSTCKVGNILGFVASPLTYFLRLKPNNPIFFFGLFSSSCFFFSSSSSSSLY